MGLSIAETSFHLTPRCNRSNNRFGTGLCPKCQQRPPKRPRHLLSSPMSSERPNPQMRIIRMPIAALFITLIVQTSLAQQLQPHILFNFTGDAEPIAPLTKGPDSNFYGTTQSGGSARLGNVFRMTPDGTVTTLVNFAGPNGQAPGIVPLTPDNMGNLYGTTIYGGSGGYGTVFKMTLDGSLTTLVNFNNRNGSAPEGLALGNDGNFYGTTVTGTNYYGTAFKVTTGGTFSTLVNLVNSGSFPGNLTLYPDG